MSYLGICEQYSDTICGASELRRRIEAIREYVSAVEASLSVHDSIMECAAGIDGASYTAVAEAIFYSREALSSLARINEVMESIGGEVSGLKWEISKMRQQSHTS